MDNERRYLKITWLPQWFFIFTWEKFQDKTEYVIHRNLKQALNHRLVLKKMQSVIKFNPKAWLNLYIDMSTELKKNQKKFSKWFLQTDKEFSFLKD